MQYHVVLAIHCMHNMYLQTVYMYVMSFAGIGDGYQVLL